MLQDKIHLEVEAYLRRRYEGQIANTEIVDKEDLDLVSYYCIKFVFCPINYHYHPINCQYQDCFTQCRC